MKLSAQAKRAYDSIRKNYVLSADGILVLKSALESFDDYVAARELVRKEGLVGADGRRHPAHDIANQCYRNFLAGFRYLGLDATPEELMEGDAQS